MKKTVFYEIVDTDGSVITQGSDLPELIEDVSMIFYDRYGEEGAGEHNVYVVHYDKNDNEICRVLDTISYEKCLPSDYEEHNVMWNVL